MKSKNTAERADEYMERIQRIYDEHMDMLDGMLGGESGVSDDEIVKDMVLAEYNFEQLAQLYELDPGEFCESVSNHMMMEDIDIWLDLLMKEPNE